MRVIILGANGRTGKHLVQQALDGGHAVTAFVHGQEKLPITHTSLRLVSGDARNAADLAAALKGQEAVISALGSNKPGDALIAKSTQALLDAMHKCGVRRVLMMSSFLVSPNLKQTGFTRVVHKITQPFIKDKVSGENLLKQSGLDWTIVYATRLDGVPRGSYHIVGPNETVSVKNAIARADVAEFMLEQLDKPDSHKKSFLITSK